MGQLAAIRRHSHIRCRDVENLSANVINIPIAIICFSRIRRGSDTSASVKCVDIRVSCRVDHDLPLKGAAVVTFLHDDHRKTTSPLLLPSISESGAFQASDELLIPLSQGVSCNR